MSDAQATPNVSLLEQFKQQHAAFVQQREQVKVQFEQLQGAIFACEEMIKKIMAAEAAAVADLNKPAEGAKEDGQAVEQVSDAEPV